MKQKIKHILFLGVKELKSFFNDKVFLIFVIWGFTLNIISQTKSIKMDVNNASVAIVDEDASPLSRNIAKSFREPFFREPKLITFSEIDENMDSGVYTFVIVIPKDFQKNILANKYTSIQVNIDATVMTQGYIGSGYISRIITQEVSTYLAKKGLSQQKFNYENIVRVKYNPNIDSTQFASVNGIIGLGTMLSIMLTAVAMIREKESGTIEHLLTMPLTSQEIMLSKIWANSLIILVCMLFSMYAIVQGYFKIKIQGSLLLFFAGFAIFQFNTTSLGVLLSTLSNNTAQLVLLTIAVLMPINFLSGTVTPLESMAPILQKLSFLSPLRHCIDFAIPVTYRGAEFSEVWRPILNMFIMGIVLFILASLRFNRWFNSNNT